jgi:hypothetical protein
MAATCALDFGKVFRDFWAEWSGQCGAAIVDNGWWSKRKWALVPQDVQCNSRIRSWGFETWQMVFSPTQEKNVRVSRAFFERKKLQSHT